jgi:uncharacterized hydrophobic protein (TIGR00271 family)
VNRAPGRGSLRAPGYARAVIGVEVFGNSETMARVAAVLDHVDGVGHVRLVEAMRAEHSIVSATVRPRSVDGMLEVLRSHDLPDDAVTLMRLDVVGRAATGRVEASLVWEDVLGMAWLYSRPIARYVAFMVVAGVIASYGVIDDSSILIVGAMAVSPDLLPIVAAAVGVVGLRAGLAARAVVTVVFGLAVASAAAAGSAFLQDRFNRLPSGFTVHATGALAGLTSISNETLVVALVAGIAGMLALETRASAGVGVAISVTTIPAAAYLGVAVGTGELSKANGALGVLGCNVAMLIVGATATLALQRALLRRAVTRRARNPA